MDSEDVYVLLIVFIAGLGCGVAAKHHHQKTQQPKLEVVAVNHGQCKCGRESKMVIYEKGEN